MTNVKKIGSESVRIGDRLSRPGLNRLLRGRGRYVADISLPRMLHIAFLRSPHAHARIGSISTDAARNHMGVAAVLVGRDLVGYCKPLLSVAANRPGHKSPPQYPLALDIVHWQGQPIVAVVAETRAEAEDAIELIQVEFEDLPAVTDGELALNSDAPVLHEDLSSNLAYEHNHVSGDPDAAFRQADVVIERDFIFNRQTGLSLETRGLIADFNPGSETLTVYHSHQSPFQMQEVFSKQLSIPENKVRVVAPDVGGAFGLKVNTYAEDLVVAIASRILGRPVKFCADRLESFVSDAHSRDHKFKAGIALSADGRIKAMKVDDIAAIGAFGHALRFNIAESIMLIGNMGAPYAFSDYRGRARNAYVNKNAIGMYRGVGLPLACAATEVLVDDAAAAIGMDPVEFRRRNIRKKSSLPCKTAGGGRLTNIALEDCLDRLVELMNYDELRAIQSGQRSRGTYCGIGISTFIESTAYGPVYYGPTGASVTSQDGCTLRLEPSGAVRCITSVTDQGQGTLTGVAQIVADILGVPISSIDMISGDSSISTYGGGSWASRGIVCGGEAAMKAASDLSMNIRKIAAAITQTSADDLILSKGCVFNRRAGTVAMTLEEVAKIGYFRQDTLPQDLDVQLMVTRSHVVNHHTYYTTSGVQASHVEVDVELGLIKVLGHWAVTDCGRVINPLLVDEQMRGGIVQGIGAVLYEECMYDVAGNLLNGTLAEYIAPMAHEMPDIQLATIETPESTTGLGAKGVGEAGLIGAMGAVWASVNDAIRPLNADIREQPFTPERMIRALQRGDLAH